ncbi:MAG: PQQ-dependent sugar dehydrogenase [Proteobacteria bacterium]|nr:PQQ-dependent sugar dehydrogenase [Pseudomonadota bacterium]
MRQFLVSLFVFSSAATAAPSSGQDCEPLQTAQANAPEQQPAFPEQTRACETDSGVEIDVAVLASGLEHPWAVEPVPDGTLLVTERPGRMRIVSADGELGEPLAGTPDVFAEGQAGMLDVALSPSFDSDRTIFWSYSEPRGENNGTAVARGVLDADRNRIEDVKVIFRAKPDYHNDMHYGSRLVFDEDGKLFVTLGERSDLETRPQAQQLDSHYGKIVRINPDGSVPDDNPFVDRENALPEIWTLGHRNIQAAAIDNNGKLWEIEHGPRGGDELNLVEKGVNYGWPIVEGRADDPRFADPQVTWAPAEASPSGATVASGSFFVAALRGQRLWQVPLDGNGGVQEPRALFVGEFGRQRAVAEMPDGALWVLTNESPGRVIRVPVR